MNTNKQAKLETDKEYSGIWIFPDKRHEPLTIKITGEDEINYFFEVTKGYPVNSNCFFKDSDFAFSLVPEDDGEIPTGHKTGEPMKRINERMKKSEQAVEALKDSGKREKFGTGAMRDIQDGNGRCDLLPLDVVSKLCGGDCERDEVTFQIGDYIMTGDEDALFRAAAYFMSHAHNSRGNHSPYDWLLDVAKHYEAGAKKYSPRNWENGLPIHCYIDSGVRHYLKYRAGWDDEPHDRAFLWNMLCAIWTHTHKPEMIDLPFAKADAPFDEEAKS